MMALISGDDPTLTPSRQVHRVNKGEAILSMYRMRTPLGGESIRRYHKNNRSNIYGTLYDERELDGYSKTMIAVNSHLGLPYNHKYARRRLKWIMKKWGIL